LPWLDSALHHDEKVVYVSFGTLANGFLTPLAVSVLIKCFSALAQAGNWRILWSLPEEQQLLLNKEDMRSHLRVESFVRQRAVLSHPAVKVFLTHGGQSSVNEGLAAGLPLVCMPLFCDQYECAESVERHGLGLVFHKDELLDGKAAELQAMLESVSSHSQFGLMAKRHASLMRIRGGGRRAGDVIESIVHVGADYQELWKARPFCKDDPENMSNCSGSLQVTSPSRRGGA